MSVCAPCRRGRPGRSAPWGTALPGALWGCCWAAPISSFLRVGCAWQRRRVAGQCGGGRTALSRSATPGRQRQRRSAGCESASISSLLGGRICGWRAECLPRMNRRWLSQQLQKGAQDAFARLWTLREAYAKWTGLGLAGLARRDQSFQPLEFAVEEQGKIRCSDSLCAAGCVRLGEHLLAVVLPSEVGAELILEEDDGSFKKIWKSA